MTGDTAMDYRTLDKIVSSFGDDNILAFVFDNGGRKLKPKGVKVADLYLDPEKTVLKFPEKDMKGVPFNVLHLVASIQAVITVDDVNDIDRIDTRYSVFK